MKALQLLLLLVLPQLLPASLNAGDITPELRLSERIFAQRKKALHLATEAMNMAAKGNRSAKSKADKLDAKISEEVGWNLKDASNLILEIGDLQKLVEDSICSEDRLKIIELRSSRSKQALIQFDSAIESLLDFFPKAKSLDIRHEVIGAIAMLKAASQLFRQECIAANSSSVSQRWPNHSMQPTLPLRGPAADRAR